MVDFQLLTVRDAHKPLGFRSEKHLYRVIRENQFPFPQAIVRFGKQIRINLEAGNRSTGSRLIETPIKNAGSGSGGRGVIPFSL